MACNRFLKVFFILIMIAAYSLKNCAEPFSALSTNPLGIIDLDQWSVIPTAGGKPDYFRAITRAFGLPGLGIYSGAGYNMHHPTLVIKHTSELLGYAPAAVRTAVAGKNTTYYSMFWGWYEEAPSGKIDNIVLHPVVRQWLNQAGLVPNQTEDFTYNVPAGIFGKSNNITAISIATDKLDPISVNYHGLVYFSPNNAQIQYLPEARLATFWLVALSPVNNNAIVTFNIVALAQEIGEAFGAIGQDIIDYRIDRNDFLNQLASKICSKITKTDEQELLTAIIELLDHTIPKFKVSNKQLILGT